MEALEISADSVKARALRALRRTRFDLAEWPLLTDEPSRSAWVQGLHLCQTELEIQNDGLMRSYRAAQSALMHFTALFHGLPIAALAIDRQGLVKESNPAAQALFRLDASRLRHQFFSRLIAGADRDRVLGALARLASEDGPGLEEVCFDDGTAEGFRGVLHTATLPESHDSDIRFVCAVLDRSASVQASLDLIEATDRLRRGEIELKKRLAERATLHQVLTETSHHDRPLEEVLARVVARLPAAWRFPELAEARIQVSDQRFETAGYEQTAWRQSAGFSLGPDQDAEISVIYREPPDACQDGLFLPEEQALLDAVASHLESFIAHRRDEARLRETIESLRVLAEHDPEWEYWRGPDGHYRHVSSACAEISGHPAEAFRADPTLFERLVHPDDLAAWIDHDDHREDASRGAGGAVSLELRIRCPDGSVRWIEHLCKPVHAEDGRFLGERGVNRDITERKTAERLAARMTSLYDALSQCNQAVVRCPEEASLLEDVCEIAVSLEGIRACAIQLSSPDAAPFRMVAVAGMSAELAKRLLLASGNGVAPGAGGLSRERPHFGAPCPEPRGLDCNKLAAEHGLRALGVYPLKRGGRPLGSMHLYADDADFFAPDIARLLEEMAADVSCALDGFAQERARRASEAAVAERERHLSAIFRSAQVGIGVSQNRVIREANQHLCDMLGYSAEELVGRPASALYCDQALYHALGLQLAQLELLSGTQAIETQWCRRDGAPLSVLLSASPLEAGQPERGLVFTAVDISARKGFEEALARSQELLNATGRLAKVGGWELHPVSGRLSLTEVAREILGLDMGETDSLTDFVPLLAARDQPKLRTANRQALTQGRPYDLQARLAGAGGRQTWLQLTCQPVVAEGRVTRLVGAVQDITDRMEAEKSLRQAARVFDSTAEGVVITDPQERILAVNRAFTEISGYAEEDVLGETPRILKSGRHPAAFYEAMWKELKQTGFWRGEIWNAHKNGEVYPELMTISAVLDSADEVTHYVGVFRDITHIKRSEEQLAFLAHHDALTGLPNRSLFQLRLEHCIDRASRSGHKAALLFIDLDRFKVINDTLGHLFGDAMLKRVAECLAMTVRAEDTIARLGGDEFVIVLEEIGSVDDVTVFAERILSLFTQPFQVRGRALFVTASIGVAIYPSHGEDFDRLVRHADISMYRAKDLGRNGFALFEPSMVEGAEDRLRLETDLRRAIERRELAVHYQPQVALSSRALIGVEALCRWQHPEFGAIPPSRFIPLAEDMGMIDALGAWVMEESCRQLAAWDRAGFRVSRLAVNLSMQQIEGLALAERVRDLLASFDLGAERLELEVTESMIMRHPERAIDALQELRSLGITLAVDDFGTGYSSLAYLKRLPLNRLKIDRSFVEHLTRDGNDDAIVRAIVGLGQTLGLATLAEGVETEAQADFLRREGCLEVQGFLFGRPLPPDALMAAWACAGSAGVG